MSHITLTVDEITKINAYTAADAVRDTNDIDARWPRILARVLILVRTAANQGKNEVLDPFRHFPDDWRSINRVIDELRAKGFDVKIGWLHDWVRWG